MILVCLKMVLICSYNSYPYNRYFNGTYDHQALNCGDLIFQSKPLFFFFRRQIAGLDPVRDPWRNVGHITSGWWFHRDMPVHPMCFLDKTSFKQRETEPDEYLQTTMCAWSRDGTWVMITCLKGILSTGYVNPYKGMITMDHRTCETNLRHRIGKPYLQGHARG